MTELLAPAGNIEALKAAIANGCDAIYLGMQKFGARAYSDNFDLELLERVCEAVTVPVIASGGAGRIEDFITLFQKLPKVDAGLAASIFHFGEVKIPELKAQMAKANIPTRL